MLILSAFADPSNVFIDLLKVCRHIRLVGNYCSRAYTLLQDNFESLFIVFLVFDHYHLKGNSTLTEYIKLDYLIFIIHFILLVFLCLLKNIIIIIYCSCNKSNVWKLKKIASLKLITYSKQLLSPYIFLLL